MLAGIQKILIISTPKDIDNFRSLLGDGSNLGIKFTYAVQPEPKGIAQAFTIAEEFIGSDPVALILGDNILVGGGVGRNLKNFSEMSGASIFASLVSDPERYGVVEIDSHGEAISIEEKPTKPKSNFAIPGLYLYDNSVVALSKQLTPSARGELEISTLNQLYLNMNKLRVTVLPRGTVWMDAGTVESLHEAASYIEAVQNRSQLKIGCLEEIAWRNQWIDTSQLLKIASNFGKNEYASYLRYISASERFEL
jgi:glucose-1-phosphate thymidylyltransferase